MVMELLNVTVCAKQMILFTAMFLKCSWSIFEKYLLEGICEVIVKYLRSQARLCRSVNRSTTHRPPQTAHSANYRWRPLMFDFNQVTQSHSPSRRALFLTDCLISKADSANFEGRTLRKIPGMYRRPFFASGRGGADEKFFGVGRCGAGSKSLGQGRLTVKLRAFSG